MDATPHFNGTVGLMRLSARSSRTPCIAQTGKCCWSADPQPNRPDEWDADEFDSGMLVPRSVALINLAHMSSLMSPLQRVTDVC